MNRIIVLTLGIILAIIAVVIVAAALTRPTIGTPERAADAFLREIRTGHFDTAFSPLRPDGINEETEMREKNYRPLWWWWLRDRREATSGWRLHYSVIRGWVPIPSPVWITVNKQADRWRVTRFEAWY